MIWHYHYLRKIDMVFIEFWNSLVKRNPGFANNDVMIKLRVTTLKALLEQSYIQGQASHESGSLGFNNIFSAFREK